MTAQSPHPTPVQAHGLTPKPEIGIQFGAGGASSYAELAASGTRHVSQVLAAARAFAEAGVPLLMVESEGITEGLPGPEAWRTDVVSGALQS